MYVYMYNVHVDGLRGIHVHVNVHCIPRPDAHVSQAGKIHVYPTGDIHVHHKWDTCLDIWFVLLCFVFLKYLGLYHVHVHMYVT